LFENLVVLAIVESEFTRDIRLGDYFPFINRRRDRIKIQGLYDINAREQGMDAAAKREHRQEQAPLIPRMVSGLNLAQ